MAGRKKQVEVSDKQIELYEIILKHVEEKGFQPNFVELREILNVKAPSIRGRIARLAEKGLIDLPPHRGERCLGFRGIKFMAYQVDEAGEPIPDQTFDMGDCVVTIKRRS